MREKLEQIKDEQNRKFSLLYEHYKSNVDAVYQQQNLKLNAAQQHEQDQLNEDLERQMNVLYQSHLHRKKQQADTFNKEIELLDSERIQKHKDLKAKMDHENEEFEKTGKQRLNKLTEVQRIILEKFDKDCFESYGIQLPQNVNNRYSVFNIMSSPATNFNNHNPHLSYFASENAELDFNSPHKTSKLKPSASVCSNSNKNLSTPSNTNNNNDKLTYFMNEGLSVSSTTSSVVSTSSASNPSHSATVYSYPPPDKHNLYQQQPQHQQQTSESLAYSPYYQFQSNQMHQQPQQQSIIFNEPNDSYIAHLANPTGLSYTSTSSSSQNPNRRNSTAFS